MPPDSQVHRQVVRKRAEVRAIELDTATRLHYVEVEEPDMHSQRGDLERLQEALQEQWGLAGVTIDLGPCARCRRRCARAAGRSPSRSITGSAIIAIWPGYHEGLYGLAVDVGSTTIAAHLCDLATGEVLAPA